MSTYFALKDMKYRFHFVKNMHMYYVFNRIKYKVKLFPKIENVKFNS